MDDWCSRVISTKVLCPTSSFCLRKNRDREEARSSMMNRPAAPGHHLCRSHHGEMNDSLASGTRQQQERNNRSVHAGNV
ncbi:hypothetical protein NQZ68_010172 [Dissostichus eleginoides]|nr:hypothetical protein NQZ68_010172 [Dissostichus eleginoides]